MPVFPVDLNSLEEVDSDAGYPNASFSLVTPIGEMFRIHHISLIFDTDGNAANRTLYLFSDTTSATMYYFFGVAPAVQTANTIFQYSFGNCYTSQATGIAVGANSDALLIPLLRPILLRRPRSLFVGVDNFQAGDAFIDGRILFERFQTA